MSHRWMKFWPQDWQTDPGLRSCSLAARGLWIECIAIMHGATPYGHLVVNGTPPTAKRLASMVGTTERDATRLLAELQEAGVFSLSDGGSIFSRRMVRDAKASDEGREAISKRWAKRDIDTNPTEDGSDDPNRGGNSPPDSLETEAEAETEAERRTDRETSSLSLAAVASRPSTPPRDGFEDWWKHYPRKVGKDAARRAYASARKRGATDADLATGLQRQVWPADPQFVPHASTWLNGGRWQDDPTAAAPPTIAPERAGKLDWLWREMQAEAEESPATTEPRMIQ